MVQDVIKQNMEHFNYSQKELSLLTQTSEKTISQIINGKLLLSMELSLKLDSLFGFGYGWLFDLQSRLLAKAKHEENVTEEEKKIREYLATTDLFKLHDKRNFESFTQNLFIVPFDTYKKTLQVNGVGFSKYKDKPLAYLWVALCQKKYRSIKAKGDFKKSSASTVYNKIFNDILGKGTFEQRFENVKETLSSNGIVLRGEPFIADSTIRGVSMKLNTQRYIFLSDMNKREYEVWLNLLHELMHFYGTFDNEADEVSIDKHARILFKTYLNKHDIPVEHEFFQVLEILENDQYEWLHEHSKLKVSFGNVNDFLQTLREPLQ